MKIATAESAGFASGRQMRRQMPTRPRPSRRAASSSSAGRAMKNCRMTNVASTHGAASAVTRMSGQCVLMRPTCLNIWNSGTIVTSPGTSSPMSTTRNSRFWPGKRMRAKA